MRGFSGRRKPDWRARAAKNESQEFEDAAQNMAALHDVDNRRLHAIERALQKIAEGTYGFSYMSGKPIPKSRLEVTPEAVLTVEEEAQLERQNKR